MRDRRVFIESLLNDIINVESSAQKQEIKLRILKEYVVLQIEDVKFSIVEALTSEPPRMEYAMELFDKLEGLYEDLHE